MALLTARQVREIEIYAGIEPIGWDVGVSRPLDEDDGPPADVESRLDAALGRFEMGKPRMNTNECESVESVAKKDETTNEHE